MSDALDQATEAFRVAMNENTPESVDQAISAIDDADVPDDEVGKLALLAGGLEQLKQSLDNAD
jgi:hypothetical protein